MTDAAKQAKREYSRQYQREYRKQHPEKCKQWAAAYWERKAAAIAAQEQRKGETDID